MLPLQLDMSKLDAKKSLRTLELDAYSSVISAFRAQGDLTPNKVDLLKELQSIFKISTDRHKSEIRRACNDDKLYTIAKLLSHGDCVSSEWAKHAKRSIPLLPSLQTSNTSSCYYRILADQIMSKAQAVFSLYPEDNSIKATESCTQSNDKSDSDSDLVHLKNGYAINSNCVKIDNNKPGEFFKRLESQSADQSSSKTFLNYLIEKYREQSERKESSVQSCTTMVKTVNDRDTQNLSELKSSEKDNPEEKITEACVNPVQTSAVDQIKTETDITDNSQKHQTLIPIQIPYQQLQSQNLKLNPNQPIKLSPNLNCQLTSQKTPKLLIPANKTFNNSQKLIILPSNANANSNLKILTTTQLNQKIVLNVPSVTKPIDTSKRKFCDVKTSPSNSNLVCLKLDSFNDESNSSTSSKNGFYDLNGSNNKKIKLIEFNPAQAAIPSLIKTNSNPNLTNAD